VGLAGWHQNVTMSHKVYMTFFLREGWNVQFLDADLKTSTQAVYLQRPN
jgi:hypothetical protein